MSTQAAFRGHVVLLHGIFQGPEQFQWIRRHLEDQGWIAHALQLTPNDARGGIEPLAEQVQRYVETRFATGEPIDLVAFSMGGVVARYYLQRLGGAARVRRCITLASPHQGTLFGWLGWGQGARQMRYRSDFLNELNETAPGDLEAVALTSLWTPLDLMIVPSQSSVVPFADCQCIWSPAHPLMLVLPQALTAIARALGKGHRAESPG